MKKELRLLLIGDVPSDAGMLQLLPRRDGILFVFQYAKTEAETNRALQEFSPDVILSDYAPVSFDGLRTLKMCREQCPDVPFLSVAGTMGKNGGHEARDQSAILNNKTLLRLAQNANPERDLQDALREITEAAAQTITVERVSVWLYSPDRSKIVCASLFDRAKSIHSFGAELSILDYPVYFETLKTERTIAAEDTFTDPRTREFLEIYLKPLGIVSMLDAPIRMGGRMIGIVCHEHTGAPRRWTHEDQTFAASISDMAAMAVESDQRRQERHKTLQLEAQLRQSQKMEAVGRLAGGVAHDFNNILTLISGYGTMALSRLSADDPIREYIQEILTAGDRAATLTRQLLAFSRKQLLQPTTLSINTVVASIEKMVRRLIGEDIEVITALDPGLGFVKADQSQIEQIIVNLAVNSRDAMPKGGKLTIETSNLDLEAGHDHGRINVTPGPYVMFAVSDTGEGMNKETQSHIFEPFFTTKEEGKGSGLGLSTVYGIVKQSEGYIWCYSEPGHGTTFKVYLPRTFPTGETTEHKGSDIIPAMGTETILVVDDLEVIRRLTCEILKVGGYTVLQAPGGDEALQIEGSHAGPIHLLLTDVVMPKMNGGDLAKAFSLRRPAAKVLYMSGYTKDAISQNSILDPGVEFIEKPFTPSTLLRKIQKVLHLPPQ